METEPREDETREEPQGDATAGAFQPDTSGADTGLQFPASEEQAEPDQEAHSEPAQADDSAESGDPEAADEREGILAGTGSELAPGVGGDGDHPAPAAVLGDDGQLHVAGEPPAGTIAPSQAPVGDEPDVGSGDIVSDEEARERLNAVTEPEPYETERPDLGTE